ncbi:Thaumatin [Melia azedarach]|uniref:Thaumatin n=2 Tax=Melia azedarach TaxID=155640 RepID=A0ACC1X316_MELAZ|nr:Thaumatin [Melia azedarach]KAJ4705023.1 Thaumatin [Melia azedarach]
MNTQVIFSLILAFLVSGAHLATVEIKNNCPYTIWPGTLTGDAKPQLSSTGFELRSGATNTLNLPSPWSGRIWARTQCSSDSGKFTCATADCGSGQLSCNGNGAAPPASLAEFTIAANNGQDFFDLSLVDGFNLPLSVAPRGGSGSNCTPTTCKANVNSVCPSELAVKGSDGSVIACKSACAALNQPQYCCTGAFGTAETCPPTKYSMIFKNQCPEAYSYAYDDPTSTFSCTGGANYVVTFCP